jgi:hypothetical protein
MTEATQLTLDTNYTPGPVLSRQAQDERDQFIADWRTARRLGLSPPRGYQSAVPAQQRCGRDYPVGAYGLRKHAGQRGQDRAVRPCQSRSWVVASQHGDLVA